MSAQTQVDDLDPGAPPLTIGSATSVPAAAVSAASAAAVASARRAAAAARRAA